jgi:rod shape-determining protein MreC
MQLVKSVFKQNIFFLFLFIVIIVVASLIYRNNSQKPLAGVFHYGVTPFSRVFSGIGFWFSDKGRFFSSIGSLKQENQVLMEENLKLKSQLANIQDVRGENEQLRKELALAPREKYQLEAALIVGKDLNHQAEVIFIDKGANQGIVEGMAVVVGEGILIGRVQQVYANDAQVELILSKQLRIKAEIQESGVKGLVSGNYGTSVIIDSIPQTVEVKSGDSVITGSGSSLPRGLLIGYIKESTPTADQLFQQASIVIPVQIPKLRMVWVVKGER